MVVLIVIGAVLALGLISYVVLKQRAINQIDKLKSEHDITSYFVSYQGYIAFCDSESKIFTVGTNPNFSEIPYKDISSFGSQRDVSSLRENAEKVYFFANMPESTEFTFSDFGGKDEVQSLLNEFERVHAAAFKLDYNRVKEEEEKYDKIVTIPKTAAIVNAQRFIGFYTYTPRCGGETWIWESDENLYLIPKFGTLGFDSGQYKTMTINRKNIVGVTQEGDIHYNTEVHGGGGGGSSLSDAVVGGVLAGEVGAIICSRKKIDPVTSSTTKIDDRATHMKILDDSNHFCEILFDYNDYYVINKLIGK